MSFNQFGNYGSQSLATVQPVSYTVTGQGITMPPAAIGNLLSTLGPQGAVLQWTGVTDTRPLDYENPQRRQLGAEPVHRAVERALLPGQQQRHLLGGGAGAAGGGIFGLPGNAGQRHGSTRRRWTRTILYSSDQGAANFPGTVSGALVKVYNASHQYSLVLGGTTNLFVEPNFLAIGDLLYDGGVGNGT